MNKKFENDKKDRNRAKILFCILFIAIGVAVYNFNNVSYEEYCKEEQAQCHLNNKDHLQTLFKNIKKIIFNIE